ncbi:hypothetical protein niasHS_008409 [Heterodera schachtii]|uniref:Uncharacterized protein n=2 Tax=Heterodera TaxID=34509 RepID=A0ABD2IX71_HETSC
MWHQYYEILSQMNERLEANYDVEVWENAEFCRNYIKFFESFRRFRARCDRDHKGVSITGNWRKAIEAEPLQEFFDADYILHDRLVYAVKGAEGIPRENGEEANGEEKEENKEGKETNGEEKEENKEGKEANGEEKEENKEGKEANGEEKEENKEGKEANGEEKEKGGNEANGEEK